MNAYQREWRKRNPEKLHLNAARARAKRLGQDFNIDISDIVIPQRCPILDIPIIITRGRYTENGPSLDRIDNSKGYVKGNVRIVSCKANKHKADLSLEDIERLYKYSKGEL